ncbi:MFS transporter [bacterium]|nr:MFS transporter [bacterium]
MNRLLAASILSISLLTIMASAAVSPALAKISQAFPGTDFTTIKLVLTIPSLLIIPFSLLSGWLVARFKKKHILMTGLIIYFLGGIGGGLAGSIPQLLVIRGLLGVGIGLVMPLSTTLIADFFQGEARTKMMGLSGSITNLGGVFFLLVSGWLACFSWRYSFGVYALSLVTLIMVGFWLPEPPQYKSSGHKALALSRGIYLCAILGMLMMICFYAVPTNLALFIESEQQLFTSDTPLFRSKQDLLDHLQRGTVSDAARLAFRENGLELSGSASLTVQEPGAIWRITDKRKKYLVRKENNALHVSTERLGRPALAGYALATMTLSGVVSGIILSPVTRMLGVFTVPTALLLMTIGFGILYGTSTLPEVFIAVPFIGLSAGFLMPSLILKVSKLAPGVSRTLAMAIVSSAVFLGQFLSPLVLKSAAHIAGNDTFRFRFGFLASSLLLAALVGFIYSGYVKYANMNSTDKKSVS